MTDEEKIEYYRRESYSYAKEMDRYVDCVKDIKSRILTIQKSIANPGYYNNCLEVEFVCLQFRSILELIILSSLVNHAKEYNKTYEQMKTLWRIKPIMKRLEEINQEYFPIPVSIGASEPFALTTLANTGNILTKDEILDFYGVLSDYTHPKNPFADAKDAVAMWNSFHVFWRKITNLLNVHLLQPLNLKVKFLVISNFENDKDPDVIYLRVDE